MPLTTRWRHWAKQWRAPKRPRALDGAAYVEAFRSFYAVLLAGSGNEIARRILETLEARIAYLRHPTTRTGLPFDAEPASIMRQQ